MSFNLQYALFELLSNLETSPDYQKCSIISTRFVAANDFFAFAFKQNSPYRPLFDNGLRAMMESGELHKLKNKYKKVNIFFWTFLTIFKIKVNCEEVKNLAITPQGIASTLTVMLMGIVTSVIICIAEFTLPKFLNFYQKYSESQLARRSQYRIQQWKKIEFIVWVKFVIKKTVLMIRAVLRSCFTYNCDL